MQISIRNNIRSVKAILPYDKLLESHTSPESNWHCSFFALRFLNLLIRLSRRTGKLLGAVVGG